MNTEAPNKIEDAKAKARRLVNDFPYYAEHVLKIRPKEGGLVPLVLDAERGPVVPGLVAGGGNKKEQPSCCSFVG